MSNGHLFSLPVPKRVRLGAFYFRDEMRHERGQINLHTEKERFENNFRFLEGELFRSLFLIVIGNEGGIQILQAGAKA